MRMLFALLTAALWLVRGPLACAMQVDTPNAAYSVAEQPYANISISIPNQLSASPQPGDVVHNTIVVTNPGPRDSAVRIVQSLTNLGVQSIVGVCKPQPCELAKTAVTDPILIQTLAANSTAYVDETVQIQAAGTFGVSARIAPRVRNTSDQITADLNGVATASASPPAPAAPQPAPTPGVIQPPANPAHLSVTASLAPRAEAYAPGQRVSVVIVIRNDGGAIAQRLSLDNEPANLQIQDIQAACGAFPCSLPSLSPGGQTTIRINADVGHMTGDFSDNVSVEALGLEPQPAGVFGQVRPPDPSWPKYAALGAAALVGLWLASAIANSLRRARWRRMTTIDAFLEREGRVSIGPLDRAAPDLGLRTHLEFGDAAPHGAIPIRRIF